MELWNRAKALMLRHCFINLKYVDFQVQHLIPTNNMFKKKLPVPHSFGAYVIALRQNDVFNAFFIKPVS